MKDTSKTFLRRGHNEGNIRQRADGRWEVRLSAGIDYKTGKPKRTSTCCNTRQEAISILQQQAHEVRTQGWRDPMSVTLGEWYEYWLDTYMKDTVKQSTYASYRSYLNKHFCVLGKILLKKLEPHTLQEFYNYKFREEGLSPKTLRNYHMALHKCLQQAVKEHLLVYNPCDAVTLPSGEKPEIVVFTNDQQRALVQASYRHRYGVFIRLDLCTGLRMGELLALKWEDIDFSTAQLHVRRTINRLAKYESHDGENKTEIVFGTPKTKNSRRTIPLTRTMVDELTRWKQQQAQDKIRAGDKYTDDGFIVTNEFGHYFEQKTFKDYYNHLLKDADIGHFTFHALRHTFATRALLFAYAFAGRDMTGKSVEDMVYEAQRKVILALAEKEPCVIIGRNADYILKDRDDVMNVFIHGDMPEKTQRIMRLHNVEAQEAAKMMADTDKRRMTNYNFYTEQKWGYAGNYTLCLNSSQLGYDRCEKIIMECY